MARRIVGSILYEFVACVFCLPGLFPAWMAASYFKLPSDEKQALQVFYRWIFVFSLLIWLTVFATVAWRYI